MINRPNYIEAIAPFIDQPLVKILAGIRRCSIAVNPRQHVVMLAGITN